MRVFAIAVAFALSSGLALSAQQPSLTVQASGSTALFQAVSISASNQKVSRSVFMFV